MRLKFLLLLFLVVALISDVTAAKDRKRNKNKGRNNEESALDDDEGKKTGGGFSITEERRKETKDRVMTLAEKEEERRKEKEEESSEEKDEKKEEKKKNSTEIEIPVRRFRRTHHELSKAKELNDGEHKPLQPHDGHNHVHHRHRRQENSLKKTSEINDGEQRPIENKPSQDHQCGPDCKHPKRLRRAKAGKKEVGHRAASHPHKRKDQGKKGGKRRNQQNQRIENAQRKPRHLEAIPETSQEETSKELKDLNSPEGKQFTYHKYIRIHGKRPPTAPEESPKTGNQRKRVGRKTNYPEEKEERNPYDFSDRTVVSADAAEIREY